MNQLKRVLLAVTATLFVSCATVPRDAGLADVQQTVSERTGQQVAWSPEPRVAGDERVAAMLQDELTADEAVAIAMMNNPRLQVTLAELGIARAELIEASTISNPLFELEIRFPGDPYRPYELRLAQSLIDLIQLPRRRAVGRAAFDAAQMRVSSEVLRFAGDVRSAYYHLLAATQHVAMTRTILESSEAAAELALSQHHVGNITDLDLEHEQARYEQAKLDLARSEQRLLLARESLVRAMGIRGEATEWRVPERFPELPAAELDQEKLEQLAATQRLDIAIAERELEAARSRVPLARLALFDAELDVHYEREPDGERTVGPGIEVPIPIFDTGRAARTRAEAEFLRARHSLDVLAAESSSRLRSARAAVAEARARVEYYRDVLLPRRGRILELTKMEANAMLVGIYQLLDAREDMLQAQRDFIEAQREYWTARTDLDRALQGVTDDTPFTPASESRTGHRADTTRGGH